MSLVQIARHAAHLFVEHAGGTQERVAIRLDIEAARVLPPQQRVAFVGFQRVFPRRARLLIRRRQHDLLAEPLQRPAVLDEARREIVEQLRMRRLFALRAEIARRGDEGLPEVPAPDAIDDDARGEPGASLKMRSASSRRPEPFLKVVSPFPSTAGKPRGTISPGVATLPAFRSGMSRGSPAL